MRTVSNFKAWAYEKAREFEGFRRNHSYLCYLFYERKTVIVNLNNGKTWTATCHESDSYDANIGKGVAFAKFLGEEIPVEQKKVKLSSLNYGDRFRFSFDGNRYTYIFITQEPVFDRYIFINEQTKDIHDSLYDTNVYTA